MYRVRDWNTHFENNRTRELKELRFVIIPNKQDGDGYTELLDHPNGPAHYAAWIAILQVASKGSHPAGGCGIPAGCCECRGTLLREGARWHDPSSLARLTRIPQTVFQEALPRLVAIGWLDMEALQSKEFSGSSSPIPQETAQIPQGGAEKCEIGAALTRARGTEQNGTEEKRRKNSKPRDARLDHPALQAVRDTCGAFPNKDTWDLIIRTVGEEPDVGKLKRCWQAWRARNYSPKNLGWVVDWYVNDIPGANNGSRQRGGGNGPSGTFEFTPASRIS